MVTCTATCKPNDSPIERFSYQDAKGRPGIYKSVDDRHNHLRLIIQNYEQYWVNLSTHAIYNLSNRHNAPDQFMNGDCLVETKEVISLVFVGY